MGLEFAVSPAVLVPNPDTETLVTRAVEWGRERGPVRIADVGTGCGCIAIALAHFLPESLVDASDISAEALAVARRNVERHSLESRVHLFEGDLLEPLAGPYDLVVANLPYLAQGIVLPAEVTAQPAVALYGGAELVNRLLTAAPAKLAPEGRVLLEVDPAMLGEVALAGWAGHTVHRDLGGRERVLEAWT
jgi:HemK-like putative methylase